MKVIAFELVVKFIYIYIYIYIYISEIFKIKKIFWDLDSCSKILLKWFS